MKFRNIIAIVLSLAILSGTGVGLWHMANVGGHTYYEGKEVFNTENDYISFKQLLANEDITLIDIKVLASEPPIIVYFNVEVPYYDYEFPYGERNIWGFINKGGGGILFVIIISCLVILLATFTFINIWED